VKLTVEVRKGLLGLAEAESTQGMCPDLQKHMPHKGPERTAQGLRQRLHTLCSHSTRAERKLPWARCRIVRVLDPLCNPNSDCHFVSPPACSCY